MKTPPRFVLLKKVFLFFLFLNVFSISFSQVPSDLKAKKAPPLIRKNVKKLAKFLTKDEKTEADKARQIYLWICNVIKYDVKHYKNYSDKVYSAKRILKRRKAVCLGYCDLFTALCREAGLTAMTIPGYSKGGDYNFGDVFFKPDHAWSAVKLNGEWKLLDITWSAGSVINKRSLKMKVRKLFKKPNIKDKLVFKRDVSDYWLTRDPKQFFFQHCSNDPVYLLLNKQNCMDVFENLNTRPDNTAPLSHDSVLKVFKQDFETATYTTEPDPRSIMDRVTREYQEGGNSLEFTNRNNEDILRGELQWADSMYRTIDLKKRDSIYLTKNLKNVLYHDSIAMMHMNCRKDDIKTEKYLQDWKNKNKLDICKDEFDFLTGKTKPEIKASAKTWKEMKSLRIKMKKFSKRIKSQQKQVAKEQHAVKKIIPKNRKLNPEVVKTLLDSVKECHQRAGKILKQIIKMDSVCTQLKKQIVPDSLLESGLHKKISDIVVKAIVAREDFCDNYNPAIMFPKKTSLILKTKQDSVILVHWLRKEDSLLKIKADEHKLFLTVQKTQKTERKFLKRLWKDTDDDKYLAMMQEDFTSADSALAWQDDWRKVHMQYAKKKTKEYKKLLKHLKKEMALYTKEMGCEKIRFKLKKNDIAYRRNLDKKRLARKMKFAKKLDANAKRELKKAGKKK